MNIKKKNKAKILIDVMIAIELNYEITFNLSDESQRMYEKYKRKLENHEERMSNKRQKIYQKEKSKDHLVIFKC